MHDNLCEELQRRFSPTEDLPSPQLPLSTGLVVMDRRATSKWAEPTRPQRYTGSLVSGRRAVGSTNSEHGSQIISPRSVDSIHRDSSPPLQLRKIRPPSELFLPTPLTSKRMTIFRLPDPMTVEAFEDAVEEFPPLSPLSAALAKARFSHLDIHASIAHAISNLDVGESSMRHLQAISTSRHIFDLPRASTAPPTIIRQLSSATLKSTRSLPNRFSSIRAGGSSSRGAGVRPLTASGRRDLRFSGIDKDIVAEKRAATALAKRKADSSKFGNSTESASTSTVLRLESTPTIALPWRRRRRGETMSMLVDAGFFPVKEYIYNGNDKTAISMKRVRPMLNVTVDDLPTAPLSIVGTPVNFYHRSPLSQRPRAGHRRSLATRRRTLSRRSSILPPSPPSPIYIASCHVSADSLSPVTPAASLVALTALTGNGSISITSPRRAMQSPVSLEVIAEDASSGTSAALPCSTTVPPYCLKAILGDKITDKPIELTPEVSADRMTDGNVGSSNVVSSELTSLPEEDFGVPTSLTQWDSIQLTNGSVLTVCPIIPKLELRSLYIQGPIKLPTPQIVPRRNSIASLAPFQHALDQLNQGKMPADPRSSDAMIVEDMLDWYEDWGFDVVEFERDTFAGCEEHSESEAEQEPPVPAPIEIQVAAHMLREGGHGPTGPSSLSDNMLPRPALPASSPASPASKRDILSPRQSVDDLAIRTKTDSETRKQGPELHVSEIQPKSTTAYKPAWSPPDEWKGDDIPERRRKKAAEPRDVVSKNTLGTLNEQMISTPERGTSERGSEGSLPQSLGAEAMTSKEAGRRLVTTGRTKRYVQMAPATMETKRL